MRLEAWLFPGRAKTRRYSAATAPICWSRGPPRASADAHLLRWAQRHSRFGVHALYSSWDNLTSKGHMAAGPQQLIVWNRIMEREARELHGYPADRIHVAGVSHFDVYARPSAGLEPGPFRVDLGLDLSRALITFGTGARLGCFRTMRRLPRYWPAPWRRIVSRVRRSS